MMLLQQITCRSQGIFLGADHLVPEGGGYVFVKKKTVQQVMEKK